MRKTLIKLGTVSGQEQFSFDDGISRNIKDFIMEFPYVYFKSGIWNNYTKVSPIKGIERCNNSAYGGNIVLEFDEKWEMGEPDGKAYIYISCPCESDMW